jgi:hypothetical protein
MPWAPIAVVRRLNGSRVTVRPSSFGGISLSLLLTRRGVADPARRGVGIALAVASPVLVRAVHPGSRIVLATSAAATRLVALPGHVMVRGSGSRWRISAPARKSGGVSAGSWW